MNALLELQRDFQARVLRRDPAIEPQIARVGRDATTERLHIYEHAYSSRLVEALGRSYGILRVALGTRAFDELALRFVLATPSRHRSIRDYGGELSAFIVSQQRDAAAPTWSELAAWEWLLADVFDAADAVPLTTEALARLPPEQWAELQFRVHPTLRRCRGATNAVELWRRLSTAQTPAREMPADDLAPSRLPQPVEWLAWRDGLTTRYRSLAADEASSLDAMRAQASFADICVCLAEGGDADQAPLRAAQHLRGWIEAGLIVGLEVGSGTVA
jgi:hypothetical protein